VQLADRVRIFACDLHEGAALQDEIELAVPLDSDRTKAAPDHFPFNQVGTIACSGEIGSTSVPVLSAHLTGIELPAESIGE
jgi:hypothetical protein